MVGAGQNGNRYTTIEEIIDPYKYNRSGALYFIGRIPDSQSREPGFESPLLLFRSFDIFVLYTMQLQMSAWLDSQGGANVSE